MDQGLLPRRYAKALLKLATERGLDARIYSLTQALAASFETRPDLQSAVANPYVDLSQKIALVNAAAGAEGTAETGAKADTDEAVGLLDNFVRLLDNNHRIEILRQALMAYRSIYRHEHNIYAVDVTSAAPLDEASRKRIEAMVQKSIGDGTAEMHYDVDPKLLGGFVLTIENRRLDASLNNELNQLSRTLLQ